MIATHNIKVNGRWIHAGEEYGPKEAVTSAKAEKHAAEPIVPEEKVQEEKPEQKAETKPKAPRRKKASE